MSFVRPNTARNLFQGAGLALALSAASASPALASQTDDTAPLAASRFVNTIASHTLTHSLVSFRANADLSGAEFLCGTGIGFLISKARTNHDQIYQTFLSAGLSGNEVRFAWEVISNQCYIKSATINFRR